MESPNRLKRELADNQFDIISRKIRQGELVRRAREAGMSWQDIGRSIGKSSSAVSQLWDERHAPYTLAGLEAQRKKTTAALIRISDGLPDGTHIRPETTDPSAPPVSDERAVPDPHTIETPPIQPDIPQSVQ